MKKLYFLSLFAGGGGFCEGFRRAGFFPIAFVESDKAACFTLKTRTVFHYLKKKKKQTIYYSYLKGKITRDELYSKAPKRILDSVINARIGRENQSIFRAINKLRGDRKVDVIIGGPPCQAYSEIGRAALKHKPQDERKTFYIHYGRFLKKYSPKLFVFENVPGLLTSESGKYFRNLKKYYRRLGYEVQANRLNAYDYGVVQNRQRVIIVGWKKELDLSYPELKAFKKKYLRDDIFYDLPPIKPGDTKRFRRYARPANRYLKKTQIRNGLSFVVQHVSRPHNSKDLNIYKLAIRYLKHRVRLKNTQIPFEMRTQRNVDDFLDRFKVVDVVPHTMIAHIAKDGHHFIHPDQKQLRSISIREAARIQSFSDDYYFEGLKEQSPRTSAFTQIGNAVPPLLAEKIAKAIRVQLVKL